jgi:hypothetical protein
VSEQPIDPELIAVAGALAHLKPRPAALDRDNLMFRAGQASAPRGWKWPLATALATVVAVGLGFALLVRPQPAVVEHTVYVKVQVPAPETPVPQSQPQPRPPDTAALVSHEPEPPRMSDYQRLEDHLLRWGFDGLPPAPHVPALKETRDSLLNSL